MLLQHKPILVLVYHSFFLNSFMILAAALATSENIKEVFPTKVSFISLKSMLLLSKAFLKVYF